MSIQVRMHISQVREDGALSQKLLLISYNIAELRLDVQKVHQELTEVRSFTQIVHVS